MSEQQENKTSIFRKKAMDRISSPEQLDQYLTVTGPGVWFPLITVAVLLVGVLIWMALGRIDVTVNVAVSATDSGVVCYLPADKKDAALQRGTVSIAGESYAISDVGLAEQQVNENLDAAVRRAGMLEYGSTVAPVKVDAQLMSGVYAGVITVENINPITYIIN